MSDHSEVMSILADHLEVVKSRPLAVVGVVLAIEAIPGADFIVLAALDCGDSGTWMGVVQKSVMPGQHMVVFLQDAILPPDERWAFMAKHNWRVRMARFKKVPSECVAIELPWLYSLPAGSDLTLYLGVTKYSKPLPKELAGVAKGNFPSFIPKTDEPNFQGVRDLFSLMDGVRWYATEKYDGTSCTTYVDDAGLHVCSRNLELAEGDSLYWRMARQYHLDKVPAGMAIQFEIVGPGVQGNPMGLEQNEIRVFTAHKIGEGRLGVTDLLLLCCAYGLPSAAIVDEGCGHRTHSQLRQLAEIKYSNGRPGEGVVIRARDAAWSFKVINLLYKD